jgi:hypothetical protein
MIFKLIFEHHNGVKSQGASNKGFHDYS